MLAATTLPAPPPGVRPTALQGFAGHWVLDAARSDFGAARSVLRAREDDVTTEGEKLSIRSRSVRASGDSSSFDAVYRADGEAENTLRGQTVRTTGRHAGAALEFVSVVKLLMLELRAEERWALAAGGDSLVIVRSAQSPLGTQRQTLRFARQPALGRAAR